MKAKERLIEFIRHGQMEQEYNFVVDGDVPAARAYVQRMRVEMSRLRDLAAARGKTIPPMTINLIGVAFDIESNTCKVTLLKSLAPRHIADKLVTSFLDDLE